ncbi:MAG: hypothetical protein ACXV8Q_04975 [Methylobacter sp.]
MPTNFDRIINWPYHPQTIIATAFISCVTAMMQGDGPLWAALIASAFIAPIAALLLFLPYFVSVAVLAALLSLPQAIRSALRRSVPTTH